MKQNYNTLRFTSKLPVFFIGISLLLHSMSGVYAFSGSSTEADSHLNGTEMLSNSVMEMTNATIGLAPPTVSIDCKKAPSTPYEADGTGTYTVTDTSLDATATSSDGGAITIVNDLTSTSTLNGAVLPIGATVVEWTATNQSSGEVVTCLQTINVVDKSSPTAVCQNITVTLDASGNASITPADIDNGSTDNTGIVLKTLDRTLFNCTHVGSNTVTLTVTDSSGNEDTCMSTVTVEDTASGASVSIGVSAPIPSALPVCSGDNVTFTATPTNEGANPHYQWYVDGTPVGADSPIFSTSELNNGELVTVNLRFGVCNTQVSSAAFDAPVRSLMSLTAPAYLCVGGSKSVSPVGGGVWASSDVSIATINNGGVITGVSAGIVSFVFTDNTTGCTARTTDVIVSDLPVISSVPATVCIGATETATATAVGTWISNNSAVATIDLNTGVITGVSVGAATFTFTDSTTGCISVASVPVDVLELPWAGVVPAIRANYRPITNPISPIGPSVSGPICLNKKGDGTIYLVFDDLPGEGGSVYNYSWTASPSKTGGLNLSAGTPSLENNGIFVRPEATTTYTATALYTNGCSVSNTITITVNPDPGAELVSDFCVADPVNEGRLTVRFRNPPSPFPTGVLYQWTNDGEPEPFPVATNHFTAPTHHFVSAVITGIGTCTYSVGRTTVENLVEDGTFSYFDPDDMSFDTDLEFRPYAGVNHTISDAGQYCVGTYSRDFKRPKDLFYTRDHTGDFAAGEKNFMIVNGHEAFQNPPSTTNTIWSQEVYVNAGTTYKMTAHVVSLQHKDRPLWSFAIDGALMVIDPDPNGWAFGAPDNAIMNMYNNDVATRISEIKPSNYLRVSHNWTAPTSGTITFSILNHKIASKGNDYGLDDISFGAIGQVIYPTSPSGKDVEVCMGLEMDEITFQASGHGTADPVFTASPAWITTSYIDGIFTLSGIPTTAGTFPYTIETTSPCGDTETISGVITVSEEISAGPDIATCSNVPVTMAGTLPVAVTGTWSGGTGSFDDASSPTAIYTIGAGDSGTVTLTYTDGSVVGSCKAFDTVDLIIAEMNAVSVIAPPSPTDCSDTTVDLLAVPLSEGTIGLWTVTSGQEVSNIGSYSFSDATSPTSTFTGMSGETYELTWTLSTPTTCTSSVPVTFAACPGISFDGVDDAVSFSNNFDALPNFSFEIWIKPNVSDGFTKTIFSKKDVNDPTKGYDLRYINDEISFYSNNKKVVSAAGVTPNRWYHIAVTFDGGDYVLYFDGMEMNNSESGAEPLANTAHFLLGGMYDSGRTPVNLFNGSVDELRIWGVALTKQQIREMMNQEIEDNGGVVYGSTIPIPVHDLSWSELHGYYQMNQGTDVSGGILAGMSGSQGSLLNMNSLTFQRESTPLPYTTSASGQWGTSNIWEGYQDLNPPNTLGVNGDVIYWNIVEIDDNVSSGDKDIIVSGLVVNSAGELIIMDPDFAEDENNPGRNLWVTNYLKLDGSIDLVGESQLLQKAYDQDQHYGSMLDPKSTGFIERDQQGIKNSFAYNYWSSPVSKIGGGVNNNLVMIEEILWDGTTTTPQAIDFGDDTDYYHADGVAGSSLKVASAWLWKLVNSPYSDTEWEFLGKNTKTISPTEGYTMKGTDAKGSVSLSTEYQNYVYRGRPNNAPFGVVGTSMLHTTFTANPTPFISLTGNPFPSALDADMFIEDNQNSTDKALYFWEHWSNGTHVWAKYQGGYAIRKVGNGVPAVSHPDLVAAGGPRNIPGAYVPVGQGFFVKSSAAGGGVVFKNSQRTFKREIGQGGASSVFIKGSKTKKNIDAKEVGKTMRIRLGFESPEGYHRQVLAAFFEGPTDGIDPLYDGRAGDLLPNDAFFIQEGENFVIQAFGEYREDREIPITVFIDENNNGGIQKFMIDDLENISDNVEIYIKDYYNDGETYDIRNTTFELPLESGEHKDRFALVFQSRLSKLGEIATIYDGVTIFMNNTDKDIIIQKTAELDFEQVMMFNSLGQVIKTWDKDLDERDIALSVDEVSSGIYIINLITKQGLITKKILIE